MDSIEWKQVSQLSTLHMYVSLANSDVFKTITIKMTLHKHYTMTYYTVFYVPQNNPASSLPEVIANTIKENKIRLVSESARGPVIIIQLSDEDLSALERLAEVKKIEINNNIPAHLYLDKHPRINTYH